MPTETRRDVFQAIADPTRRQIIDLLSDEPMTMNAIADKFQISRPQNLIPAFLWLEKYEQQWIARIDNFEKYVNKLKAKQNEQQK